MRLRHIEIFEAIRRTGSLTQAAAALHITQPAASKLLASAEAVSYTHLDVYKRQDKYRVARERGAGWRP